MNTAQHLASPNLKPHIEDIEYVHHSALHQDNQKRVVSQTPPQANDSEHEEDQQIQDEVQIEKSEKTLSQSDRESIIEDDSSIDPIQVDQTRQKEDLMLIKDSKTKEGEEKENQTDTFFIGLSEDGSSFPQSYEEAAGFLKKLLNSYYIEKLLKQQPQQQEVNEASVCANIDNNQQSQQEVLEQQKVSEVVKMSSSSQPAPSKRFSRLSRCMSNMIFMMFLLMMICSISFALLSEQEKQKYELLLHKQSKEIERYTQEIAQLTIKNELLKNLAEKSVEEEKRNCDFFDILSILKNTIGSKKKQNIHELCSHYQRYEQLENSINQFISQEATTSKESVSQDQSMNSKDQKVENGDEQQSQEQEIEQSDSIFSKFSKLIGNFGNIGKTQENHSAE